VAEESRDFGNQKEKIEVEFRCLRFSNAAFRERRRDITAVLEDVSEAQVSVPVIVARDAKLPSKHLIENLRCVTQSGEDC
jgi:hypothetical protein